MTIRAILLCIATCTIARDINAVTNKDDICSSAECHKVASELSMIMDPTVDPCENFYDFVCGSYVNSEPVNINWNYVKSLRTEMYKEVTQLIQADIKPNEPKTFKLVKKLYNSCMNTAAIEAKGLNSLWQHLRDLGGWPVVEGNNWVEEEFNRWRNINQFRRTKNRQYYISDGLGHCAIKHLKTDPTVPYVEVADENCKQPVSTLPIVREGFEDNNKLIFWMLPHRHQPFCMGQKLMIRYDPVKCDGQRKA